jgi:hypothetical protein
MTAKQEALYRFILMAVCSVGIALVAAGYLRAVANTERIVRLETEQKGVIKLLEEVRTDVKTLVEKLK